MFVFITDEKVKELTEELGCLKARVNYLEENNRKKDAVTQGIEENILKLKSYLKVADVEDTDRIIGKVNLLEEKKIKYIKEGFRLVSFSIFNPFSADNLLLQLQMKYDPKPKVYKPTNPTRKVCRPRKSK